MPRKKQPIEPRLLTPGDQGYEYDLNDPNAKSEVLRFEETLKPYLEKHGPYAFEHLCADRRLYLNCEWKKMSSGNEALINASIAGQRAIDTDGRTFIKIHSEYYRIEQLYAALKRLWMSRAHARKMAGEVPLPDGAQS